MITPPVRSVILSRRSTYLSSLGLFASAAVLSAAAEGSLWGVLGYLFLSWSPGLLQVIRYTMVVVAIAYALAELAGTRWPVPTRHWLVPKDWGLYGRQCYAALFGLTLGTGLLTVVNFVGLYLLIGLSILSASPWLGAFLLATYGLSRVSLVLLAPMVAWLHGRAYTFETACSVNERWPIRGRKAAWIRVGSLVAVSGALLARGVVGV